jgi:predicted Fe-Mo cluster-binding NifX family protein
VDRVIVPVAGQNGLDAKLAEHFGRAPYYAVVDINDGEVVDVKTVANTGEHAGGTGQAHDKILELKPNAIIVYGMGPRGLNTFQDAGVAVLKANSDIVRNVIAAYKDNTLQELTEGCAHAHHSEHVHHSEHIHHY